MNYYWVNHNQTARQELEGGYLWSPKLESNGSRSQFYEFMREARPGDSVVSYAGQLISNVGVVAGFPVSAPKPEEFGNIGSYWSNEGWYVPVSWSEVPRPFRPKLHIEQIRPLLPERYSPLQESGNGNQKAYLSKINSALMNRLATLGQFALADSAGSYEAVEPEDITRAIEDQIEHKIGEDESMDQTEKEALIKARRGQGKFRRNVEKIENACRVTGLADARLLVASHIKPWRVCETAAERLDGANGLLLSPQIDKVFDIGLISFKGEGEIVVSETLSKQTITSLGLLPALRDGVGRFSGRQCEYLDYHLKSVFLG